MSEHYSVTKFPFKRLILLLSFFICLGVVLVYKDEFRNISLNRELRFDHPSLVIPDKAGNLYVVDNSMMRILKISSDGTLVTSIAGGKLNDKGLYRTRHLAVGDDGRIYCVNNLLD